MVRASRRGGSSNSAQQQQPPSTPRFEASTGVTHRLGGRRRSRLVGEHRPRPDREGLHRLEDGKPQKIETFSFQEIAGRGSAGAADIQLLDGLEDKVRAEAARAASATSATTADGRPGSRRCRALINRRMLTILFDVSSMQPDDVQRAVEEAREWVGEKMTGADLVAIITIGSRLNVLTDFTSSREDALAALQALAYNEGTEVNPEAIATAATEADAAATESHRPRPRRTPSRSSTTTCASGP